MKCGSSSQSSQYQIRDAITKVADRDGRQKSSASIELRSNGLMFVVDAHAGDGQRFIVHVDELLSAFLELEATLLK